MDLKLTVALHPVFRREYSAFFERFADSLRAVGVRLCPAEQEMSEILEQRQQTSVDLAFVQWVADYPDSDAFVHVLQSREGFMGPLCGSPEIDQLIERGKTGASPETRHAAYREIEEIALGQARILPLFHEQVYRFARPEVEGLAVSYWSPTVPYEELRVLSKTPSGRLRAFSIDPA